MSVSLHKMLKGPNAFYNKDTSTADLLKPKPKADYKVKGLTPTEDKASNVFQAYVHRALSTAAALPGQAISLFTGDSLAKNY